MKLTRQGLVLVGALVMSAPAVLSNLGCASSGETGEERVRIVRPQEKAA